MREFKNHDLVDDISKPGVRYEKRPAKTPDGKVAGACTTPGSRSTTRPSTTPTRPTWSRA